MFHKVIRSEICEGYNRSTGKNSIRDVLKCKMIQALQSSCKNTQCLRLKYNIHTNVLYLGSNVDVLCGTGDGASIDTKGHMWRI